MSDRSGWTSCELGDVVELQRGFDITKASQSDGDVPVVSSSGIGSYHSEARAPGPGVIVGRKGTVGSVHYCESDYWPHDTTLWSRNLRGNNARFVYYLLGTLDLKRFDVGNSNPTLNRNHIHRIEVRVPERREQDRIATILASYDDLIDTNRRRMALLEQAARELYREWFVRLRFPGCEHVPVVDGVPEGWRAVSLGDCSRFLSGGTPSKSRADYWNGAIPWVSSGELTAMRIHRTSLQVSDAGAEAGSRIVPTQTVLAVVRGMSLAKEFRIGLTSRPMAFNQDIKAIVPMNGLSPLYLFHALDAQRAAIRERTGEASHGTKKLESSVLAAVGVLIPRSEILELFVEQATVMHAQWDTLERQNHQLHTARDLLLPRLMRGELLT